jgi:hypothetical protein
MPVTGISEPRPVSQICDAYLREKCFLEFTDEKRRSDKPLYLSAAEEESDHPTRNASKPDEQLDATILASIV